MASQSKKDKKSGVEWSNLPIDLLGMIFKKLSVEDLITGAPLCCSYWYRASKDPCLLKQGEVDLGFLRYSTYDDLETKKKVVDFVVARSQGHLTSVRFPWSFDSVDLLLHLAKSYPKLKYFYLEDRYGDLKKEERIDRIKKFCSALCKLGEIEGMAINKYLVSFYTLEQIHQFCPNFGKLEIFNEQSWVVKYVVSKVLPKIEISGISHTSSHSGNEQESLDINGNQVETLVEKALLVLGFWSQCMVEIN